MGYILLTIYMLIGFQIGARVFFWGRNICRSRSDFIVPLVVIPLAWPVVVVMVFCSEAARDSIFNWESRDD